MPGDTGVQRRKVAHAWHATNGTRESKMDIRDIPWRTFRRSVYEFRKHFFTKEKPDVPTLMVEHSVETVSGEFGMEFLNPKWPLSYRYYGEDYNARRYFYDKSKEYPHRQLHIRGFEKENGKLELMAHVESAPEHHPKAHLKEKELSWKKGTIALKHLLDNAGLRKHQPSGTSGEASESNK